MSHPPLARRRRFDRPVRLTHNETSTGVAMEIGRPMVPHSPPTAAAWWRSTPPREREACGRPRRVRRLLPGPAEVLRLRRRPLGGAPLSRRHERIERISASGRWVPAFLDLKIASTIPGSTRRTTRRTRHHLLFAEQLDWLNGGGGLEWAASRCDRSAEILYTWAERSDFAQPFVAKPSDRSHVVGPSTSWTRSTPRRSPRCCGPMASSTPSPTASSAATSCASPCSGHRARRHRRPLRRHQLRGGRTGLSGLNRPWRRC